MESDFLGPYPSSTTYSRVITGKLLQLSVHQPRNRKEENNSAYMVDHLAESVPIKHLTQCQTLGKNKTIATVVVATLILKKRKL